MELKKILIVDDDSDILEALKLTFESDYNTRTITEGQETFEIVREFKPNLILLDIFLSGIDGRAICKDLKNSESSKNIPVIMISANRDVAESAEEAGADFFFAKPFDVSDLSEKVEEILGKSTKLN